MGALAESEAARIMQRRGVAVLPVCDALGNTSETRAPMLLSSDGTKLVAPDLLVFRARGHVWVDVKGKAVPSWHRNLGRWEHGIDYANFLHYEDVERETGLPAYLLIREDKSPEDPEAESPLRTADQWWTIALSLARECGDMRPLWPGGKDPTRRGRDGLGGWLWPRRGMRRWVVE